jgi:hypothetical protein
MNFNRWTALPAVLGIACAGVAALPMDAIAASITRVPGNFAFQDPSTPEGWENLNWVARGRASAPGDWEFGVTTDDNINGVVQQANWNWVSGQEVPWDLLWDDAENKLTFTIGGRELILDQTGPADGVFNGFFLWTNSVTTNNRVSPGTEMFLQVNTVNGMAVDPSVNSGATSPGPSAPTAQVISKFFYASDEAITSMSGFARMTWPDDGLNPQDERARDRVAFKIEGFYTGDTDTEAVPEPASVLGLLALGAVAVAGRSRRQQSV